MSSSEIINSLNFPPHSLLRHYFTNPSLLFISLIWKQTSRYIYFSAQASTSKPWCMHMNGYIISAPAFIIKAEQIDIWWNINTSKQNFALARWMISSTWWRCSSGIFQKPCQHAQKSWRKYLGWHLQVSNPLL